MKFEAEMGIRWRERGGTSGTFLEEGGFNLFQFKMRTISAQSAFVAPNIFL